MDAIVEHQAITQLVLALVLVVLQLEGLERFQLQVVQPDMVQPDEPELQRHIRLCHIRLCHIHYRNHHSLVLVRSIVLVHSKSGMRHSSVLVRCMPGMNRSLVLVHSKSGIRHSDCGDSVDHSDCGFCTVSVDSSSVGHDCVGQLQRCWRAALRPTQTEILNVALFYPS